MKLIFNIVDCRFVFLVGFFITIKGQDFLHFFETEEQKSSLRNHCAFTVTLSGFLHQDKAHGAVSRLFSPSYILLY